MLILNITYSVCVRTHICVASELNVWRNERSMMIHQTAKHVLAIVIAVNDICQ